MPASVDMCRKEQLFDMQLFYILLLRLQGFNYYQFITHKRNASSFSQPEHESNQISTFVFHTDTHSVSLASLLSKSSSFGVPLHLISRLEGMMTDCVELSMPRLKEGNTFQNLRVSSPAPVTICCPHGLIDK